MWFNSIRDLGAPSGRRQATFAPASAFLGGDPQMAGHTQRHEIAIVMGAAIGQRDHVVDDDKNGGETTITAKGGRSTSKNRNIKYVCPEYGAIIRATKQVNVVCGECNVAFERA